MDKLFLDANLKYSDSVRFSILKASVIFLLFTIYVSSCPSFAFFGLGNKFDVPSTGGDNQNPTLVTDSNISQQIGLVANGTIYSTIKVPHDTWFGTGLWQVIINDRNPEMFKIKMIWHDLNGSSSYTHELLNLQPSAGQQLLSINQYGNNLIIAGVVDVMTNGRTSWHQVPVKLVFDNLRRIEIMLDDYKTNHHFSAQPIYGSVASFVRCSDMPGPNMEILPSCPDINPHAINSNRTPSINPIQKAELPVQNITQYQDLKIGIQGSPPPQQDDLGIQGSPPPQQDDLGIQRSNDSTSSDGSATSEDAPNIKELVP